MRLAGIIGALFLLVACGSSDAGTHVTGTVMSVDGRIDGVESFVIRTETGDELTIVPEQGLTFHGGPLGHLSSHTINGAPVDVVYVERDGDLVAISVADAAEPHEH